MCYNDLKRCPSSPTDSEHIQYVDCVSTVITPPLSSIRNTVPDPSRTFIAGSWTGLTRVLWTASVAHLCLKPSPGDFFLLHNIRREHFKTGKKQKGQRKKEARDKTKKTSFCNIHSCTSRLCHICPFAHSPPPQLCLRDWLYLKISSLTLELSKASWIANENDTAFQFRVLFTIISKHFLAKEQNLIKSHVQFASQPHS